MPASAEEEWTYWDTKATELRRTQLATVQTAATKWAALLTALLGVFGAVAFAGGLTTIDKLGSPYAIIAKLLTTLAAIAAILAVYLFAQAAGGLTPRVAHGIGAASVRQMNTVASRNVMKTLKWGKRFAVSAAVLVLGGSALVLWVGDKTVSVVPPAMVAVVDGRLICGELTKQPDGTVLVGDHRITRSITQIVSVGKCP